MNLDLRIPMGMMFAMMGTVLLAFGFTTTSKPQFYARSLGIDVNLWWGVALLAFGLWMTVLGRRGQAQIEKQRPGAPGNSLAQRKK